MFSYLQHNLVFLLIRLFIYTEIFIFIKICKITLHQKKKKIHSSNRKACSYISQVSFYKKKHSTRFEFGTVKPLSVIYTKKHHVEPQEQ